MCGCNHVRCTGGLEKLLVRIQSDVGTDHDDLITFYNKKFVSKLKKVALEINNNNENKSSSLFPQQLTPTLMSTNGNGSSQFITPVNGTSNLSCAQQQQNQTGGSSTSCSSFLRTLSSANLEFSPRRVADESVFMSPSKHQQLTPFSRNNHRTPVAGRGQFQFSLEENCLSKVRNRFKQEFKVI